MIEQRKNYFIKEIDQNELMSKKDKELCMILNHIEHILSLASAATAFISTFAFTSLVGIPIGVTKFAVGLRTRAITTTIKKYKSIIKEKNKNDQMVLLAKAKLNSIEVLIPKALID